MIERETMDLEEAARLLGIGRNTAYAAAKAKQFPVIKIGKRYLVPIAAFKRFLEWDDEAIQKDSDMKIDLSSEEIETLCDALTKGAARHYSFARFNPLNKNVKKHEKAGESMDKLRERLRRLR